MALILVRVEVGAAPGAAPTIGCPSRSEDDSRLNVAALHVLHRLVDVLQRNALRRPHVVHPRSVELEDLTKIDARAHDRADRQSCPLRTVSKIGNCDPGSRRAARRRRACRRGATTGMPVRTASAQPPVRWQRQLRRAPGSRRRDPPRRVHGERRAELAGERELVIVRVDCATVRTSDPRVLECQVPQAADAEDRHEVGRSRSGDLDRLVRRYAGARERCRLAGSIPSGTWTT